MKDIVLHARLVSKVYVDREQERIDCLIKSEFAMEKRPRTSPKAIRWGLPR